MLELYGPRFFHSIRVGIGLKSLANNLVTPLAPWRQQSKGRLALYTLPDFLARSLTTTVSTLLAELCCERSTRSWGRSYSCEQLPDEQQYVDTDRPWRRTGSPRSVHYWHQNSRSQPHLSFFFWATSLLSRVRMWP